MVGILSRFLLGVCLFSGAFAVSFRKCSIKTRLGGGNSKIFDNFWFTPFLGKWSNLSWWFQTGWNHLLVVFQIIAKPTWSTPERQSMWHHRVGFLQFAFVPMTWLVFLKCAADSKYHGSPEPSFLGAIIPIYWGFKTFIFHGFGGSW